MTVTIIGVGLIGGSLALDLKKSGLASRIIGVDKSQKNLDDALALGIVDRTTELKEAIHLADVVVIAIPVDAARKLLPEVLDLVGKQTTVVDLGSSKAGICDAVRDHPSRGRYVACHPIAGTEFSGPHAAHHGLFEHKVQIICNREESDPDALEQAIKLSEALSMQITYMNATEHDRHIAYVSHLSHVTSFTLGLTVLDIEKDEKSIFNMAGSGFASTVRLAKSSSDMWVPIFEQNADNLLEALDAYMDKLGVFRDAIASRDRSQTANLINEGNEIRRILEGIELKNKENNGTNG